MPVTDGVELPSGEAVRQALERVMARPEFLKEPPGPLDRFWEAVRRELRAVFEAIGDLLGHEITGTWSEAFVLIGLLLVLGAILAHLAWSVLQLRVRSDADVVEREETETDAVASDRRKALAEASRLAAAGAFAEAMHALYQGVVTWLDERGHVRCERFKTGADYAADLDPALRTTFRSLLSTYYPVAFGGRRASEAEWLRMRRAASDLGLPA
jgi:hypothetical protein